MAHDNAPIFEQYPGLVSGFPYLRLANLPTPLNHQPALSGNLWVKNDSTTSALYGGNKVRKLEFILPRVKQRGKQHVVTFGGTGTNHGLATALFCRELGLRCTVLLFDQHESATSRSNYTALQASGAELIHCGSVFRTALSFYLLQKLRHPKAYFLFAGGSNVEGCLAFVNAAFELKQQCDETGTPYPDTILVATGSTGSCAGLTLGCHLAGIQTKVIGVRTAEARLGPIPTCTTGTIRSLMKKTLKEMRRYQSDLTKRVPQAYLLDSYFGTGYGAQTQAGNAATERFAEHGIRLEQTYTAKAAAAALDYAAKHPHRRTLYWHTYTA